MEEPTVESVTKEFLDHVRHLIDYWDGIDESPRYKLEGLAHSILTTMDGLSGGFSGFVDEISYQREDESGKEIIKPFKLESYLNDELFTK